MCGPSGEMKALNTRLQSFASSMESHAKTVFGKADAVANKILGSLDRIVDGGPSQMGFGQAEFNAKRAANVEGGATMARNLKGATASSVAAIGGGNTVMPAGGTEAMVMSADQQAAAATAAGENAIMQQGYERGNADYWKAVEGEGKVPGMYSVASEFDKNAITGLNSAMASQQQMDTQKNWWKGAIMKGVSAVAGAATGGLSTAVENGVAGAAGNLFKNSGGGGPDPTWIASSAGGGTTGMPNYMNLPSSAFGGINI